MTVVATHSLLSGGASAEAPPGCLVCEEGYIYGTTGFAGSYAVATPDGTATDTYCITQGLNYPNTDHASGAATDYADQAIWAALFDLAGPSDADKAAVSMRVHRDLEGNGTEWAAFADLRDRSDALWAQAAAWAGPYATTLEWRQRPDAASGGAGVVAVAVRAGSGTPLPHASVTVAGTNLSAPGAVDTGPSGIVEVAVAASSPGPWSVSATAGDLPPTSVLRYEALAHEQTVVGPGPRTQAAGAADAGSWDVPTEVTVHKLDARTRAPLAGAVIEIRAADGTLAAEVTTGAAPTVVPLPVGQFAAHETREPDGYLIDDRSEQHFAVTMLGGRIDLVWADTPATPTVSTRASAARVSPGDAVHDSVTVAGLPPSIGAFPIRVRYLGPTPPPADGDCASLPAEAFAAAAVVGEATVMVTGNGQYSTPAFTAPKARGCTTFDVASLAPLWPGGPLLSAAPNAAEESIEVVSVVLSTVISPAVVEPGGTVSDRITITGLPAWSGARQLTVSLIGPVAAPGSGQCADLSAAAFRSAGVLTGLMLEVTEDGVIDSPALPVDVTAGQCVTLEIVDDRPLWPGGPVIASPRGLPSETALVRAAAAPSSASSAPSSAAPTAPTAPSAPAPAAAGVPAGDARATGAVGVPTSRPVLASTGPEHVRNLLAGAAALLGAGIGVLLLVPGSATAHRGGIRRGDGRGDGIRGGTGASRCPSAPRHAWS